MRACSATTCVSAEILKVAKLEKVSDTAYGKMIWSLFFNAPQVWTTLGTYSSRSDESDRTKGSRERAITLEGSRRLICLFVHRARYSKLLIPHLGLPAHPWRLTGICGDFQ